MDKNAQERGICVAFLFAALIFPFAAFAQPAAKDHAQLERQAQELSESMMSPFCPGRTISSCPSPQARELRAQMQVWLEQGYTEEAVRNQLRTIYGEDIKGEPDKEGFGLVGWLAPFVFVAAAFAIVVVKLQKMKRNSAGDPASPKHTNDAALGKLEAELKMRQFGKSV